MDFLTNLGKLVAKMPTKISCFYSITPHKLEMPNFIFLKMTQLNQPLTPINYYMNHVCLILLGQGKGPMSDNEVYRMY